MKKKLSVFFCTLCIGMTACFPVFADVIGPGQIMPAPGSSVRVIWGAIVSAVMAAASFLWRWLTHKK